MIKATLKLERETKGALLFREVDAKGKNIERFDDGVVGNLYIRKTAIGDKRPDKITITIDF